MNTEPPEPAASPRPRGADSRAGRTQPAGRRWRVCRAERGGAAARQGAVVQRAVPGDRRRLAGHRPHPRDRLWSRAFQRVRGPGRVGPARSSGWTSTGTRSRWPRWWPAGSTPTWSSTSARPERSARDRGTPSWWWTCCTCCPRRSNGGCSPRLPPNSPPAGRLVIKEMSRTPRWKAAWNTAQETLAVSILGITERASTPAAPRLAASAASRPARFEFVAPETMAGWLADAGLDTSSRRLDRGRIHPHHLLVGRRPG